METRQVSSTVIEVLHLINRSNMMQTTQETLTTAQNERLHTLLLRNGAGRPVLALHRLAAGPRPPTQVPAQRRLPLRHAWDHAIARSCSPPDPVCPPRGGRWDGRTGPWANS